MKKTKTLSIVFILCLFAVVAFLMTANKVYAEEKNEVTLNFEGGTIHDGYVEYSGIAKLQLFKGDELVTNITNNMTIDLNEANYEFLVQEEPEESSGNIPKNTSAKMNINNWYYPMTRSIVEGNNTAKFKLESNKFNGALNIKLVRAGTVFNTKVENAYTNITSNGTIDLSDGKEYIIDFSKNDELTNGLKTFADLDKTLYYKRDNKGLLATDNESEAVIKIVGNKSENKAILTAVNVGTKKSEVFKGLHTAYDCSYFNYDGEDDGVFNNTITDYYTKCTYNFTLNYNTINKVELSNAILSFNIGETPKFSAKTPDGVEYEINFEEWVDMTSENKDGISSNANRNALLQNHGIKLIDSFKESHKYSYSVELKLKDNSAKVFDSYVSLILNGTEVAKLSTLNNDALNPNNENTDSKIYFVSVAEMIPTPIIYKFLEGEMQTYTINSSSNARFRIDADYSLFANKVYVDNVLVDPSNYDSKSGSTIIILKDKYLRTLSEGEHTLKVAFSNGEALSKFEIKNIQGNPNPTASGAVSQNANAILNPKTGDNILIYDIIFEISVFSIMMIPVINKRK